MTPSQDSRAAEEKLSPEAALDALNALRSNIVATQRAGWSDTVYPLVAVLDAAGYEKFEPTEEQEREHRDTYGGAGGFPGRLHRETGPAS